MKALAIIEDGKNIICCSCALKHAEKSGYPNLYFAVNKAKQVNAGGYCDECNRVFHRLDCMDAAGQIPEYL